MRFWPPPTDLFALDGPVAPLVAEEHGSGPPVVLLHGQPGDGHDWDRVVGALGGRVRAIVPDRPGYGRTGGSAGTIGANADAVVALLDARGVERATIVGYSWAGAIALDLLRRHPARVAGVVLVSAVGGPGSVDDLDRLLAAPVVGPLFSLGGLVALRVERVRRLLAPAHSPIDPTALDRIPDGWLGSWRSFVVEERALIRGLPAITEALAPVEQAVEVLIGTADRVVRPASQEAMAQALGAAVVRLEGFGHLLALEAPDLVADAVVRIARR
ncbi:MAG: alpha/beta fold hydrolase [Acidimicrobiales bacterium]